MAPELPDGASVLAARRSPTTGAIVVARLPDTGQVVVKRVERIESDGSLFLRGDGEISTDSIFDKTSFASGPTKSESMTHWITHWIKDLGTEAFTT